MGEQQRGRRLAGAVVGQAEGRLGVAVGQRGRAVDVPLARCDERLGGVAVGGHPLEVAAFEQRVDGCPRPSASVA